MLPFGHFTQDQSYALKTARIQSCFTAAAVLTIALGIGASAAMFSVIYAVMLHPLSFKDGERFVHVWSQDGANRIRQSVSYPDFLDWRRQSQKLERMAAWTVLDGMPISIDGVAVRGEAVAAVGDFFQSLNVQPAFGAVFSAESERREASVVLNHGYWQRRFNSDPEAIGRSITIYGVSFKVIGVMPEGFQFPIQARTTDLWATLNLIDANSAYLKRNFRGFDVMGLLKPDATLAEAQSEMDAIAAALAQEYPENKSFGVQLVPELKNLVGNVRRPLMLLFAAVGALLLIGCLN